MPVALAIITLDLVSTLTLGWVAWISARVVLSWAPASADAGQLRRERAAELASVGSRAAFGASALASLLLVWAVASVLPRTVPGAMCGTGVLTALGPTAAATLGLRALCLVGAVVAFTLDALNRRSPTGRLTVAVARACLALTPLFGVAAWRTASALLGLERQAPVDCCATVYGPRAQALGEGGDGGLALAAVALALVVVLSAARARWASRRLSAGLGVAALLAPPLVGRAVVLSLSPYFFGVLAHPCPWCFFLPIHGALGYPLLAALALVTLTGISAAAADGVAAHEPSLAVPSAQLAKRLAVACLLAALALAALAVGPALHWRLVRGAWLSF